MRNWLLGVAAGLAMCSAAAHGEDLTVQQQADVPITLSIDVRPDQTVDVTYRLAQPVKALHFTLDLGDYRAEDWDASGVVWSKEGKGEKVERADGQPFQNLSFRIPVRYRSLIKNYAPFSPFSEGSTLIYSGQFYACPSAPCAESDALPIDIVAPGKTIGVEGRRIADNTRFISREDGTNIFVGALDPVAADGFVAMIDPGLPENVARHLGQSLPHAMDYFAGLYGPLSFQPELYVSIDARPRADGNESTQGGTLLGQIFMHFDGGHVRERLAQDSPFWLDWFFAHEAAHLFQQDKANALVGDDTHAWMHEGGADAMAALELMGRGAELRDYAINRTNEAATACSDGLANVTLGKASASGNFDLHYQCGLLIWLALNSELTRAGQDGLHALNKAMFARIREGASWRVTTFLRAARDLGISQALVDRIIQLDEGGYADPVAAVADLYPAEERGAAVP